MLAAVSVLSLLVPGCSSTDIPVEVGSDSNCNPLGLTVLETSAYHQAIRLFRIAGKATRADVDCRCDYIVHAAYTRSEETCLDTLAYVFNFGDREGFAVVSAHSVEDPIIAYSDEGYFDKEIPSVKENVIEPLRSYLGSIPIQPDRLQPPKQLPWIFSRWIFHSLRFKR